MRDEALSREIERIWNENFRVYGVRKVWGAAQREGSDVARCTVERLMRRLGLRGVIRGRPVRTTVSDRNAPCPLDHVRRNFKADRSDQFWVSDSTYVSTWEGFVYVAFAIDVSAGSWAGACRRRAPTSCSTPSSKPCMLPVGADRLVHHSDPLKLSKYVSTRYTERLADAGLEPSVGSVGDSYDNALAETINGLYKAEVIHRRTSWRRREDVEWATLQWVDWYNNRRLMGPLGYVPPAETEAIYCSQIPSLALTA